VLDLVSGNLNAHGLGFPDEALRAALEEAWPRAAAYAPDPLGRIEAREAIAAACDVPPDRILVTPGTSTSYLWAFSVLCDAGDEILVPRPSYPLFDGIARVAGVRLVPYWLREVDGWRSDLEHLESQVSTRTRAIALISPHNPTGAVASAAEVEGVTAIARRHDLAILSDEVFDAFLFDGARMARPAAIGGAPLVLTLNGLSKTYALPGWKIGWIAVTGDEERAATAAWMLAHVADTFLPVNEAAQCALPGILARGGPVRAALVEHARTNREIALAELSRGGAVEIVPPRGGLFLTMRLCGDGLGEGDVALDLVQRAGILVHPGNFYDLPPDHLVMSYAAAGEILRPALRAMTERLGAR
jgi:aspartate/methionine/tyrosine aminotransferase